MSYCEAADLFGGNPREIDVEQRVIGPRQVQQSADHLRPESLSGLPRRLLAVAVILTQRHCRNAEQRRLHCRRNGARIGQILADIAAAIDAG